MACAFAFCCGASRGVEQLASAAAERTKKVTMRMAHSSVGPGVLSRCGEDAAAVRKRHATARGVVRSVSRPEAIDLHHIADLQDILADTLAHQKCRRST